MYSKKNSEISYVAAKINVSLTRVLLKVDEILFTFFQKKFYHCVNILLILVKIPNDVEYKHHKSKKLANFIYVFNIFEGCEFIRNKIFNSRKKNGKDFYLVLRNIIKETLIYVLMFLIIFIACLLIIVRENYLNYRKIVFVIRNFIKKG